MNDEREYPDASQLILSVMQGQLATYEVTGELMHRSGDSETLKLVSLIRTLSAWQVAAVCDAAPRLAQVRLSSGVPTLPDAVRLLPTARLTKGEIRGVKDILSREDWIERQLESALPISPERLRRIMLLLSYL